MDTKTKINTVISIVLVTIIASLAYWMQLPAGDLKAQVVDTDTVLVRIQDFAFDPDIVRIDANTTVSWLHDESEGNADVQHTVTSYDPEDTTKSGDEFESDLLSLGDTFSHTFTEEGVYYYNCSLHPFMTGKVCVGDASEILDDECAVDISTPKTTATEETVEEEEDMLEDLLPAADEDLDTTTIEDEIEDETVVEEEAEEDSAAEAVLTQTDTTTQTQTTMEYQYAASTTYPTSETYTNKAEDSELADSGPENMVYLLVAFIAGYISYKRVWSRI